MKIKDLELGKTPRVVGVIDRPLPAVSLQEFAGRGIDIFEARVDLFNQPIDNVGDYIKEIKAAVPSPLIGTIRETDFNRADRAEWYISLARFVDCIDVELGMPEWRKVADGIAASRVIMMVSEHDFDGTPDVFGLRDIVKRSVDQGAAIVKIAVMANDAGDVTRLMRFTEDCETPIVTMAMGDVGMMSRIVAPLFGSLFTYGYLHEPLVPGQPSATDIARTLDQWMITKTFK